MYKAKSSYKIEIKNIKKMYRNWKIFIIQRPKLILGYHVKKIQKIYIYRLTMRLNNYASIIIQKTYRGYLGKKIGDLKWYEYISHSASIIIRMYRSFLGRKRNRDFVCRRHMAAYKIQV